jgi:hypothetical protein
MLCYLTEDSMECTHTDRAVTRHDDVVFTLGGRQLLVTAFLVKYPIAELSE